MADFLDRLVARSRVPAPPPRGPGRQAFAIEDAVVVAPSRPAPAPVASPATRMSPLPTPTAPAASPDRKALGPPREPEPAVVRVEIAAPDTVEVAAVARAVAEPAADAVRFAPGPVSQPPPSRTSVPSARPRLDTEQPPVSRERVVERTVEARTDVRTEAVLESRSESVTAVAPQVARPVTATQPRIPVSPQPVAVPGSDPAPPAVHIHIGRLDVRGADEPAPAVLGTPAPTGPTGPTAPILSLGDYLRGRAEAQS